LRINRISLYTHPLSLQLRSTLRKANLTGFLSRMVFDGGSEHALAKALEEALFPGCVFWDVGANIGLYAARAAKLVGPAGRVFAFEPSHWNLPKLQAACTSYSNITVLPFGLSSGNTRTKFLHGTDAAGATSRVLFQNEQPSAKSDEVDLRCGDDVIAAGISSPHVIKIDVEGHEFEVLQGLARTLAARRLRSLLIEIHFALLEKAGRPRVAVLIECSLRGLGFTVKWIGASHLIAERHSKASIA
jgi:FkbM family methyltransferase